MPILQERARRLLPSDVAADELNHTILHGRRKPGKFSPPRERPASVPEDGQEGNDAKYQNENGNATAIEDQILEDAAALSEPKVDSTKDANDKPEKKADPAADPKIQQASKAAPVAHQKQQAQQHQRLKNAAAAPKQRLQRQQQQKPHPAPQHVQQHHQQQQQAVRRAREQKEKREKEQQQRVAQQAEEQRERERKQKELEERRKKAQEQYRKEREQRRQEFLARQEQAKRNKEAAMKEIRGDISPSDKVESDAVQDPDSQEALDKRVHSPKHAGPPAFPTNAANRPRSPMQQQAKKQQQRQEREQLHKHYQHNNWQKQQVQNPYEEHQAANATDQGAAPRERRKRWDSPSPPPRAGSDENAIPKDEKIQPQQQLQRMKDPKAKELANHNQKRINENDLFIGRPQHPAAARDTDAPSNRDIQLEERRQIALENKRQADINKRRAMQDGGVHEEAIQSPRAAGAASLASPRTPHQQKGSTDQTNSENQKGAVGGKFVLQGELIQLPGIVEGVDGVAGKIEALRILLEEKLGIENFKYAYNKLAGLDEADDDEAVMEEIRQRLGRGQMMWLSLIHQLIVCEDSFFSG